MGDAEIGGHVGTAGGFPVVHLKNNIIVVEAVAKIDVKSGHGETPAKRPSAPGDALSEKNKRAIAEWKSRAGAARPAS